jgi:hypothetical protein
MSWFFGGSREMPAAAQEVADNLVFNLLSGSRSAVVCDCTGADESFVRSFVLVVLPGCGWCASVSVFRLRVVSRLLPVLLVLLCRRVPLLVFVLVRWLLVRGWLAPVSLAVRCCSLRQSLAAVSCVRIIWKNRMSRFMPTASGLLAVLRVRGCRLVRGLARRCGFVSPGSCRFCRVLPGGVGC